MRSKQYSSDTFGEWLEDVYQEWPYGFYAPRKLTSDLELEPRTLNIIQLAQLELGRVSGLAVSITNPDVLLAPALLGEALSSSRIEGTQASLTEVLSVEDFDSEIRNENLREVYNYRNAMRRGADLLQTLPLTARMFCAMHETLLEGVRGSEKYPGELRSSPVWIGSPGAGPMDARFIPPLPDHVGDLITDWEKFANEPNSAALVVQSALLHYQFETIHPFLDGNGRVGRLLVSLHFVHSGLLNAPVLNMSPFFERNKGEYYDRLQAVRERGQMDSWIRFYAEGLIEQCRETTTRISNLMEIQSRYFRIAATERAKVGALIHVAFANPILTVAKVTAALKVSEPTAYKLLTRAVELGWLRQMSETGRGGKRRWFAHEIWFANTRENVPGELDG